MKVLLVLFKNIMTQKALPKMKMKLIIAYGLCVAFNLNLAPGVVKFFLYGDTVPQAGALSILMAIVLPFGVVLGGPVFKLITPQEAYIKRAKLNLIISEWFLSVFIGVGLYMALAYLFFGS